MMQLARPGDRRVHSLNLTRASAGRITKAKRGERDLRVASIETARGGKGGVLSFLKTLIAVRTRMGKSCSLHFRRPFSLGRVHSWKTTAGE